MCFLIKLGRHVSHCERINPIDYEGQRSKVKVTMDIYGNKLVNTIATKPLCISLSHLVEMLTRVRGWILLILEARGQRSRSQWTRMENPIESNPLCASLSNLADILTTVNPIWRSQFKGEFHDGYHWQMWGARGCYALRWFFLLRITKYLYFHHLRLQTISSGLQVL